MQNYPNPFNPTTQIGYILDQDGFVELTVYDITGRKIRTLVSENRSAGVYRVIWNGHDDSGKIVNSGVYLYQLRTADEVVSKRMIFVK